MRLVSLPMHACAFLLYALHTSASTQVPHILSQSISQSISQSSSNERNGCDGQVDDGRSRTLALRPHEPLNRNVRLLEM